MEDYLFKVKTKNTRLTCWISLKSTTASSLSEVFCKTSILKFFSKFTGKHLCRSLFFNKVEGLVFSCELWEIFKNSFFIHHLRGLLLNNDAGATSLTLSWCLYWTWFHSAYWSGISNYKCAIVNSEQVFDSCTAQKVSLFRIILVRISPHSDWMRRDTSYLSVLNPNTGIGN